MPNQDLAATGGGVDVLAPAEPCTREEAEKLVTSAVTHANGLLENLNEIWRRHAWEPLGYASIGDLLKSPMVAAKILNPVTSRPYSRAQLYRIANAANFRAAIAEAAEVDIADLAVDERRLRELGAAGLRDVQRDVVEEIDRRQEEYAQQAPAGTDAEDQAAPDSAYGSEGADSAGAGTPPTAGVSAQEAQGIMEHRLAGGEANTAPRPGQDDAADLDDEDEAAVDAAAAGFFAAPAEQSDPGTAGEAPAAPAASDGVGAPLSATAAFDAAMLDDDEDEQEGRGSRAPESTVTMADALAAARVYGDTNASATRIEGLGDDLARTISTLDSAVNKGREALSTFFTAGEAGRRLVDSESKAETLASSLSEDERRKLADRLDRVADLGGVVEVVNELCREITEREDVSELAGRLNLAQVQALEAGQIAKVCGVLASELRGSEPEDDLEALLADLGV